MNKEKSATIHLDFPIQLADRVLENVTVRRPVMKDLRLNRIKGPEDVEGEFKLFCALTGLRPEEMDEVDSADYARLQDAYVAFRTPAEQRNHS